jgi:hypothetical protein
MNHLKSSRLAKGAAVAVVVVVVAVDALLVEIMFFFLIENVSNKKTDVDIGSTPVDVGNIRVLENKPLDRNYC